MKLLRNVAALTIGAVNAAFTAAFLLTAYSPYIQPVEHPLRSCLGLAFPIFLIANICFLFFWLIIQHYKLALLPQFPYRPPAGRKPENPFIQYHGL